MDIKNRELLAAGIAGLRPDAQMTAVLAVNLLGAGARLPGGGGIIGTARGLSVAEGAPPPPGLGEGLPPPVQADGPERIARFLDDTIMLGRGRPRNLAGTSGRCCRATPNWRRQRPRGASRPTRACPCSRPSRTPTVRSTGPSRRSLSRVWRRAMGARGGRMRPMRRPPTGARRGPGRDVIGSHRLRGRAQHAARRARAGGAHLPRAGRSVVGSAAVVASTPARLRRECWARV